MHKSLKQLAVVVAALAFLLTLAPLTQVFAAKPNPGSSSGTIAGGAPVQKVSDAPAAQIGKTSKKSAVLVDGAQPSERVNVLVVMNGAPLARAYADRKATEGAQAADNVTFQKNYSAGLKAEQASAVATASRYGKVLAQLTNLLNGFTVEGITRADAAKLEALPNVNHVTVVPDFKLDLNYSVPFIGAEQVRTELGLDGRGVKIAVIDTGVDYTHRNFGGPGTVEAYDAASSGNNPKVITDTYMGQSLFPTAKVVGGYDFVGDAWNSGLPLIPDPDPLDTGPEGGHGSHVAGIATGFGVPNSSVNGSIPADFDGTTIYHGVAPAAELYAYRVCTGLGNSCSGVAMIEGFDRAADPNDDGSMDDHVDVINMSIGSPYGASVDTEAAANNAVDAGIAVSISAGNSANVPFITGAPASAAKVLSVASSHADGTEYFGITISSEVSGTELLQAREGAGTPLSETGPVSGTIAYSGTVSTPFTACSTTVGQPNPYPEGSLDGKIALIDRGVCSFQEKALNAQEAGAVAVIVANNQPGLVTMALDPTLVHIPAVMITQAEGVHVKQLLAEGEVSAYLAPYVFTGVDEPTLADVLSTFTSRGPSTRGTFKPDIAAPGDAILSTGKGTGDQGASIGGTSMASPHIAGSLALMKQLHPTWGPLELESVLINSSKKTLYNGNNTSSDNEAPISQAGAGRVDLVAASELSTTVRSSDGLNIFFGLQSVTTGTISTSKTFMVSNHSEVTKTYDLSTTTQFGPIPGVAVSVAPQSVEVGAGGVATATVTVELTYSQLPTWVLDNPNLGVGGALSANEAAGYVDVTSGDEAAHIAWYVLPRKAAVAKVNDPAATISGTTGTKVFAVKNESSITETTKIYNLLISDAKDVTTTTYAPFDIEDVGVREEAYDYGGGFVTNSLSVAISTYDSRVVPFNGRFHVYIDTDGNGTDDTELVNTNCSAIGTGCPTGYEGTQITLIKPPTSTNVIDWWFTETEIDSPYVVLVAPLSEIGLASNAAFKMHVVAEAYSEALGDDPSPLVDWAPDAGSISVTPGDKKFTPNHYDLTISPNATRGLSVAVDLNATEAPELGLMLIHQNAPTAESAVEEIYIGQAIQFSDVHAGDYYAEPVEYLTLTGAVSGYADGTFRPFNTATRSQVVKIVVLAENIGLVNPETPTFSDVPTTNPFYQYVETAVRAGIISGYSDGTFKPFNNITRSQLTKVVTIARGWDLLDPATPSFTDVPTTNAFYQYVETAYAHGIISGYADGTFKPFDNAVRAQIAKIVYMAVTGE